METIVWGIIGCGDVTEKKSGPAFNKVPDSSLAAVMRRDAAKAEDYARRHGVPKWYSNADELLDDAGLNAIYIATPPASHLPYALEALKKGYNVYVEKPVTLNAAEAEAMAAAAKQAGRKLVVAHYRRRVPLFLRVKQLLDDGIAGEVRTVQLRMWQSRKPALVAQVSDNWRVNPELSGGGYFHDLAPHQLDLMLYYFGEPDKFSGYSLNQAGATAADDHVCGTILFKNNIVFNGSWCFNVGDDEQVDSIEIVGTRGRITFACFGNYIKWHSDRQHHTEDFVHPEHIQQPMIADIVKYFNGETSNPCTIEEAITLMKIMDAFTGKP